MLLKNVLDIWEGAIFLMHILLMQILLMHLFLMHLFLMHTNVMLRGRCVVGSNKGRKM